mgnify:FL=1
MIVYGTFDGLEDADENLYIYTRSSENKKILVICNFTEKELDVPASIADMVKENRGILIGNYKDISEKIRPYEAVVYLTKYDNLRKKTKKLTGRTEKGEVY